METQIVISGLGGQGIQVTGALFGHSAVAESKRAMFFAMFDGAQRGGISECIVALSDGDELRTPPTMLQPVAAAICMHPNAYFRFEKWLKPGGLMVYNSSITVGKRPSWMGEGAGHGGGALGTDEIEITHGRSDIAYLPVPCSNIAQEDIGNVLVAALVGIGAFAETTGLVGLDTLKASLKEALRPGRHRFIPLNERALDAGRTYVQQPRVVQSDACTLFTLKSGVTA